MTNSVICEGKKVLIVEDEEHIRKFININLKRNGFLVYEAASGEQALTMAREFKPHIIILDIMLPGIDGFEVCRRMRDEMPETIIIMLTARGQDTDKITGLEIGADDYMVKPFNPLELIARIKSILRRTENSSAGKNNKAEKITCKNLELNIKSQRFLKNGTEINLTPTEFSIIKTFMLNPGKAMSRDELLNHVWGYNYFGDVKTVDVYIRRIREKIEDDPSNPKYIETVWGMGYRWNTE